MASRYFVGGGTGNWNSTTNWSTTSGGASGASAPVSTDNVFLDANSGANTLTINVASACLSITCTGFAGTLAGSSNLSVGSGGVVFDASMTITATGTLISTASNTITSNGKTWTGNYTVSNVAGITATLSGDFTISGNFVIGGGGNTANLNGSNLYVGGNMTIGGTTSVVSGTAGIIFNGSGVWSSTQSSTGNFRLNVTFNTAGIITISGNINYRTGTITYTAGTIVTTGSTLNLRAAATLNTAGMTWGNVTINFAAMTITINSLLSIGETLTLGAFDVTFTGTAGFSTNTLSMTTALTAARSLTLEDAVTYTITNNFTVTGPTNSFRYTFLSSNPGTRAILTLNYGAYQNVGYTNATDIDSSLGQTVYSFNGVLSNTLNWSTLTYPRPYAHTFQH